MTEATAQRMGVDFEDFKKAAAESIPVRRVGQPIDIANVIAFLCSDDSGFVSGQTIYPAGGPTRG
jgi:3-oxoacyl-[acyl-carrier protein] reductase